MSQTASNDASFTLLVFVLKDITVVHKGLYFPSPSLNFYGWDLKSMLASYTQSSSWSMFLGFISSHLSCHLTQRCTKWHKDITDNISPADRHVFYMTPYSLHELAKGHNCFLDARDCGYQPMPAWLFKMFPRKVISWTIWHSVLPMNMERILYYLPRAL